MARGGRKRKATLNRRFNGRIIPSSHEEREKDVMAVALQARERVYNLTPVQASRMPESSVIGRLRIVGDLTEREYRALAKFASLKAAYDSRIGAPRLVSGTDVISHQIKPAPDPDKVVADDSEEAKLRYAVRVQADETLFLAADAGLIAASITDRFGERWAVYLVAVEDGWHPGAMQPLKRAAMRLAGVFGIPEDEEREAAE